MKPRTIGIVGGAGPLAGAYLLDLLLRFASSKYGCYKDADFPKVILISYPFVDMLTPGFNPQLVRQELKNCLNELRGCGAEILAIACNTLHVFLDQEESGLVKLPQTLGQTLQTDIPLVLCTNTSRNANLYQSAFDCVYPEVKVQIELDNIIDQILRGNDQISCLSNLIASLPNKTIILGCTELSLLKSKLSQSNKKIIDPLEAVALKILEKSFYKTKELK